MSDLIRRADAIKEMGVFVVVVSNCVEVAEQTEPRGCDADCHEDCDECAEETRLWREQTERSER